jgi:hypothetical protein
VKGNFHARFCSRGGGSAPLVYCNRTRNKPRAAQLWPLGVSGALMMRYASGKWTHSSRRRVSHG